MFGCGLDPQRLDGSDHASVEACRLGEARGNDPLRRLRRKRRSRRDDEPTAARALVLATLVERADVAKEARENRLVQIVVLGGHLVRLQLQLRGDVRELPLQLLPFAHTDERQEVLTTPLAQLIAG